MDSNSDAKILQTFWCENVFHWEISLLLPLDGQECNFFSETSFLPSFKNPAPFWCEKIVPLRNYIFTFTSYPWFTFGARTLHLTTISERFRGLILVRKRYIILCENGTIAVDILVRKRDKDHRNFGAKTWSIRCENITKLGAKTLKFGAKTRLLQKGVGSSKGS